MSFTADDVRRVLGEGARPPLDDTVKHAAVAAVFHPNTDLLFIRRAEHPGDPWSGHIAFPGGRIEPHDEGPRAAAERETLEEIGLDLSQADYLGALPALHPISHMPLLIHPFVWSLRREPELRPNAEVQTVHRVALDTLLAGDDRAEMPFSWAGNDLVLPRVDFDGVRLWGLTLRIVDEILDRLDGKGLGLDRPRRARGHV
jgi:8-oxo-dGTP pyrophosphatase MutT (NUDIX family)